jgi:hypothetical protein
MNAPRNRWVDEMGKGQRAPLYPPATQTPERRAAIIKRLRTQLKADFARSPSTAKSPTPPLKKPLERPKGYRTIVVEGQTWFWCVSAQTIIARNQATGAREVADHATVDRLQAALEPGAWDDRRECSMVEPRHVSAWLKDVAHWVELKI